MIHQAITGGDVARSPDLSDGQTVRLLRVADLTAADRGRWADLTAAAGAANIFAEHWFMDAALRHSASAREARLAVVQRIDGTWAGALPLLLKRRFGRWPVANWRTWSATNQFLGAPLVRPEAAHGFWAALLCHLDGDRAMLLHCRHFAWDDPACAALLDVCKHEGRAFRLLGRHERPAHLPQRPPGADSKAQARLRSLRRRLDRDHGPASLHIDVDAVDCTDWVDMFLALEKAGWKGQAGSALACDPATENLFREVIAEGRKRGRVRLATLTSQGRPIAMSSWFVGGDRGFGFKAAYDEAYRAYAPGLLLMQQIAEEVSRDPAMHFDTCASGAGGRTQPLWNGTRTIFDCAVATGSPLRRRLFGGLMQVRAAYGVVRPR